MSAEHQDQRRASILAMARPLHLVVLRPLIPLSKQLLVGGVRVFPLELARNQEGPNILELDVGRDVDGDELRPSPFEFAAEFLDSTFETLKIITAHDDPHRSMA